MSNSQPDPTPFVQKNFLLLVTILIVSFIGLLFLFPNSLSEELIIDSLLLPAIVSLGGLFFCIVKSREQHQLKMKQMDAKRVIDLQKLQKEQQVQLANIITIEKKSVIVEDILTNLEDYSTKFDPLRKSSVMSDIQDIRKLFYKVFIYFNDSELLESFKKAFVAHFKNIPHDVLETKYEIVKAFKKKLTEPGNDNDDNINNDLDKSQFNHHLADLIRGYLNLGDAAIFSIRLPSRRKERSDELDWLRFRFKQKCTRDDLIKLDNSEEKTRKMALANLKKGDLLVFWTDPRHTNMDGVLGIIWVSGIKNNEVILGHRFVVSHNNSLTFKEIQSSVAELRQTAELTDGSDMTSYQPMAFEGILRNKENISIKSDDLSYLALDGLGRTIELLSKKYDTQNAELIKLSGKLAYDNGNHELYLNSEAYFKNKKYSPWLHSFVNYLVSGEIAFIVEGVEYEVDSFEIFELDSKKSPFEGTSLKGSTNKALINPHVLNEFNKQQLDKLINESFSMIKLKTQLDDQQASAHKAKFKEPLSVNISCSTGKFPYTVEIMEPSTSNQSPEN
jgi:hypothetical protein